MPAGQAGRLGRGGTMPVRRRVGAGAAHGGAGLPPPAPAQQVPPVPHQDAAHGSARRGVIPRHGWRMAAGPRLKSPVLPSAMRGKGLRNVLRGAFEALGAKRPRRAMRRIGEDSMWSESGAESNTWPKIASMAAAAAVLAVRSGSRCDEWSDLQPTMVRASSSGLSYGAGPTLTTPRGSISGRRSQTPLPDSVLHHDPCSSSVDFQREGEGEGPSDRSSGGPTPLRALHGGAPREAAGEGWWARAGVRVATRGGGRNAGSVGGGGKRVTRGAKYTGGQGEGTQ